MTASGSDGLRYTKHIIRLKPFLATSCYHICLEGYFCPLCWLHIAHHSPSRSSDQISHWSKAVSLNSFVVGARNADKFIHPNIHSLLPWQLRLDVGVSPDKPVYFNVIIKNLCAKPVLSTTQVLQWPSLLSKSKWPRINLTWTLDTAHIQINSLATWLW